MPDSMGAKIPTARHRRMSERPNEPVLQSRKESDHALRCNLDWQCKLIFSCIVLERLLDKTLGIDQVQHLVLALDSPQIKGAALGRESARNPFPPA